MRASRLAERSLMPSGRWEAGMLNFTAQVRPNLGVQVGNSTRGGDAHLLSAYCVPGVLETAVAEMDRGAGSG